MSSNGPRFLTCPEVRDLLGPSGANVLPAQMIGYLGAWLSQEARSNRIRVRPVTQKAFTARQERAGKRYNKCNNEYNIADIKKVLLTRYRITVPSDAFNPRPATTTFSDVGVGKLQDTSSLLKDKVEV
jgi:hypothetical protein